MQNIKKILKLFNIVKISIEKLSNLVDDLNSAEIYSFTFCLKKNSEINKENLKFTVVSSSNNTLIPPSAASRKFTTISINYANFRYGGKCKLQNFYTHPHTFGKKSS